MPRFSPDELKAIVIHYGSYDKAAEKLGVNRTSLNAAATADIRGRDYSLSPESYDKIYNHIKRLSDSTRAKIRDYERLLGTMQDHLAVKRAFMSAEKSEQEWALEQRQLYSKRQLSTKIWTHKVMGKFYDKYGWKPGKFRK